MSDFVLTFSHERNSWLARAGNSWHAVSANTARIMAASGYTILDAI